MADLQLIADELRTAQDEVRQIETLTGRMSGFDVDSAYEVARMVHDARVGGGAAQVGRKIGFTNPKLQAQYGVREPIWAHMYDKTVARVDKPGSTFSLGRLEAPRIEPEIVLHFRSTPPSDGNPDVDIEDILACVDWIAHGFEIVRSPYPDWKFQVADAVAASSMHGALLLGEPQPVERLGSSLIEALESFTLLLSCDGQLRDTGTGANVLGNPLDAIAHLMTVLARQSTPLQAGEMVTTGSITAALLIQPGETWQTEISGIGLPGLKVEFVA